MGRTGMHNNEASRSGCGVRLCFVEEHDLPRDIPPVPWQPWQVLHLLLQPLDDALNASLLPCILQHIGLDFLHTLASCKSHLAQVGAVVLIVIFAAPLPTAQSERARVCTSVTSLCCPCNLVAEETLFRGCCDPPSTGCHAALRSPGNTGKCKGVCQGVATEGRHSLD